MATAETVTSPDTWNKELEQLRARFKHVRPPILAAFNVLVHDANVSVEDAKARAAAHGVRITAASLSAAKRLLAKHDDARPIEVVERKADGFSAVVRPSRRRGGTRGPTGAFDAESLVRGVVAKIQGHGNVEAERLREGIRKAISALQATLGA